MQSLDSVRESLSSFNAIYESRIEPMMLEMEKVRLHAEVDLCEFVLIFEILITEHYNESASNASRHRANPEEVSG